MSAFENFSFFFIPKLSILGNFNLKINKLKKLNKNPTILVEDSCHSLAFNPKPISLTEPRACVFQLSTSFISFFFLLYQNINNSNERALWYTRPTN